MYPCAPLLLFIDYAVFEVYKQPGTGFDKEKDYRFELRGGRFDRIVNASAKFCSVPCELTRIHDGLVHKFTAGVTNFSVI